jgi:uncharacterized protein (DUF433 family)
MAEQNLSDRITIIAGLCSGEPTIRGMRFRVANILEAMAEGASRADLLESYPDIEDEDISAALAFAAKLTMKSAA